MTKREELAAIYEQLNSQYGGISSTSTNKFDEMKAMFAAWLKIAPEDVYICGAGTRPGNLEVRLSQGVQATKFTKLGLGVIKATTNRVEKLADSAVVTIKKFLGRGKANYDAIGILVDVDGELGFYRLLENEESHFADTIQGEFPELVAQILTEVEEISVEPGSQTTTGSGISEPSPFQNITSERAGYNLVLFGAPGTSKSYLLDSFSSEMKVFRTTFYPDYSYGDFFGMYRPTVGHVKDSTDVVISQSGEEIPKPINYFEFNPGVFVSAISHAYAFPNDPVALIIEELNRGDCASIFGDAFQLLDRDPSGSSRYGISIRPEVVQFFRTNNIDYDNLGDGLLYIPSNLYILSTMNTSDQSLFPVDSAFKRRWNWKSCPIEFSSLLSHLKDVVPFIEINSEKWDWIQLLKNINSNIILDFLEDKQLGPWFIIPDSNGIVSYTDFANKFLFYLWHDVYKEEQHSENAPFKYHSGITTFEILQRTLDERGLKSIFKESLLQDVQIL